MSCLPGFFATMRALLVGRTTVGDAEREIGPSPSGPDNFDFYRVLVERSLFKILRDVYEPIRVLALRQDGKLWAKLVRAYAADHPPDHYEPNRFAERFGDWLGDQRKRLGELPELFEELADYQWIRHAAGRCPDDVGDGFEQRLFARHYSYDVARIAAVLTRDANADLPGRQPVVVLVYRHLRNLEIRTFHPTRAGLAVLARRQGTPLPPGFGALPDLHRTEIEMIEHGILIPAR